MKESYQVFISHFYSKLAHTAVELNGTWIICIINSDAIFEISQTIKRSTTEFLVFVVKCHQLMASIHQFKKSIYKTEFD